MYLSVAEVMTRLSVSRSTVLRLIEAGDVSAIKVRGSVRIDEESLTWYLEMQKERARSDGQI